MTGPSLRRTLAWLSLTLMLAAPAVAAQPDSSAASEKIDPATVQRYGPAYRYPRAGWIVVHVEGKPYDRGYQQGRLLAREIADYIDTLAVKRSPKAPGDAWRANRTAANALFLRRFDAEFLEEMKGIADGAAAAGAKFDGRAVDFLDLVAVNAEIELDFLDPALDATANGLESKTFREPADLAPRAPSPDHCSAFAATGPATADGHVVIGHITMFGLYFVRHFNVWLDIQPEKGHRVMMQTYPGGIWSGMDYYQNDAGIVLLETTIKQTKLAIEGETLASRARKAMQYSDTIDQAVNALKTGNNGLYTNEWLLADTKTDEIAMFELGTHKTKLWRSGKDEWFGGTKGFYWGCNNAKDLDVRLETVDDVAGRPMNMVFHPTDRDRTWLKLYDAHKGKISAEFGFVAFTTPPLSAFRSLDAKFTTSAMAREMKSWALFGPPLGKAWDASDDDLKKFPAARPLISNDWTVLGPEVPPVAKAPKALAMLTTSGRERGSVVLAGHVAEPTPSVTKPVDLPAFVDAHDGAPDPENRHPIAWHGTILPGADVDLWLASSFADYEKVVALDLALHARAKSKGRALTRTEADEIALARFAPYSQYTTAVARLGHDIPLQGIHPDLKSDHWYGIASGKGVLLLDALRKEVGDTSFLKTMDDFGRANAGKPATALDFLHAFGYPANGSLKQFFVDGLNQEGMPGDGKESTTAWSVGSFEADLDRTVIVYGTTKESDAQREAATRLRRRVERKWSNIALPVMSDREATPERVKGKHLLLIGRPDTNSLTKALAERSLPRPIEFGPSSFVMRGDTFANPLTSVVVAGKNPDDPRSSVVVFAGLSAEATWHCVDAIGAYDQQPSDVILMPAGGSPRRLALGGPK